MKKILIILVFGFIVLNVALSFVPETTTEVVVINEEGDMSIEEVKDSPQLRTINYQREKVCYEPRQGFSEGAYLCQDMDTLRKMNKYTVF